MLNDKQILEALQQMPPPLKAELVHYMEYLLARHAKSSTYGQPQFGSAKGFYETSADFDEPLQDFEDYMQ